MARQQPAAVRWNSLDNLTQRKKARPAPDEDGNAPTALQTVDYAETVNAISRFALKASICVVACVVLGRRFVLDESGTPTKKTGTELDALMAPVAMLVTHGDAVQAVAAWVTVLVMAPLVVSAMILNNADRLGAMRSSRSGRSGRFGTDREMREPQESTGHVEKRDNLAITPPARSPYGNGLRAAVGEGRSPGLLFSGGDGEGLLGSTSMQSPAVVELSAAVTTPGSGRSGLTTPGSTRLFRSTTPGSRTPPIQTILQDFDAAADAAVTDARGFGAGVGVGGQGFAQQMGLQQQTFMSMQQPLSNSFAEQMMHQPLSSTYRPSAVRKGYVSTPLRSDGSVVSSLPTDRDRVLAELGIDEDILERAVEALREWIACRLLQPLVKLIGVAHTNVINSAKSIGIEVPRDSLIDLNDYGVEPSSRLSDQMLSLGNFYSQVTQQMAMPANANNPVTLKRYERCLRAIVTYNGLLRLLRAELIPGMLPASPEGYVLRRIKELANGTALYDFVFDAGGENNGRAWNAEYPTDTALVLYLFACFLAAPFWSFADKMDYSKVEGPADVLFLGKLPPRIAGEFTAILPSRVPKGCAGTALQGLQLGTINPHIAITFQGMPKLTESGQLGLFRTIVLWLMYVAEGNGVLGNVTLSSLHLDSVLSKRRGFKFIEELRKLHLW